MSEGTETLPVARSPAELLNLIVDVGRRLASMDADWWMREHFKPSPNPTGAMVIIDDAAEARWHRRRAATKYRDELRLQALRLCAEDQGLRPPPAATSDAERDITDALATWCAATRSISHPPKAIAESAPAVTVAGLRQMTGLANATLNKYAKMAGVPTPSRGKRSHRYSIPEVRAIVQAVIAHTSEGAILNRCRNALESLK